MKIKNKKILYGSLCAALVFSSVVVPIVVTETIGIVDVNSTSKKYSFAGQTFNSKNELFEFAKRSATVNKQKQLNRDFWTIEYGNETMYFQDINELNAFINSLINTHSVLSSFDINTGAFSDISDSELYKLSSEENNEVTTIYQGREDSFFDNEIDAKKSYLSIHDAYYFDGIYFRSKEELAAYLGINYDEYQNELGANKKIVINAPNSNIKSRPIDIENLKNSDSFDFKYLESFVKKYANEYLRVYSDSSNSYQYYKKDEIENNIANIKVQFDGFSYIDVNPNGGKSNYIVDTSIEDKYELYGPYYTQAGSEILKITNPDNWQKVSGNDWTYVNNLFETEMLSFFVDLIVNDKTDSSSIYPINIKEIETYTDQYFKYFYRNAPNAFNEVMSLHNTIVNGKRYSSFYKLPILYIKTIEELMYHKCDYNLIQKTREYYDYVAKYYDYKLKLFIPNIFLKHKNGIDLFSFSELFAFNKNSLDLNYNIQTLVDEIVNDYNKIMPLVRFISTCFSISANLPNILNFDLNVIDKISKNEGNNKFTNIFKGSEISWLEIIFNTITKVDKNLIDQNISLIANSNDINRISRIALDESEFILYIQKQNGIINIYTILEDEIKEVLNHKNNINYFNSIISGKINSDKSIFKNFNFNEIKNICFSFDDNNKNNFYNYFALASISKNFNISSMYDLLLSKPVVVSDSLIDSATNILLSAIKNNEDISNSFFNLISKMFVNNFSVYSAIKYDDNWREYGIIFSNETGKNIYDAISGILDIVSSVGGMMGAASDLASGGDGVGSAVSLFFGIIDFAQAFINFINEMHKIEYSSYIFRSDNVTYIWNGGVTESFFFGTIKNPISDINSMKMLKPQMVTKPHKKHEYYYRNKFYDNLDRLKVDQLHDILNGRFENENVKTVYSFEDGNLSRISSEKFGFENIGSLFDSVDSDLVDDVYNDLIGQNSKYSISDCYIYSNGIVFDKFIAKDKNIVDLINKIKPVKIAVLPNTINNYVDVKNPGLDNYLLPEKSWNPLTGDFVNETDKKYIIYDPNINKSGSSKDKELSEKEIIELVSNMFFDSFEVESKSVLTSDLIHNNKFSDFSTNISNFYVYRIELNNGYQKIFLDKAQAFSWLLNRLNFRVYDYYTNIETYQYEGHTFNNLNEYLKWVLENAKEV